MKKLIVICIVSALCACVIIYGITAFCWWDINPAHWNSSTRFVVSLFAVTIAPFLSTLAVQLYKEYKKNEDYWK